MAVKLQTSSGLLPEAIYEVCLEPDDLHGWKVTCGYRGVAGNRVFEFGGGDDPRSWLAFKLTTEFDFPEDKALEAAHRLFAPYLPQVDLDDGSAEPYGMPP